MYLSFEVTLQNCNALLIGVSSPLQVFDLSSQGCKIALTQLVGLNLSSVRCNYPLTDVLANLCHLVLLLVLLLNFLVLDMLSLFTLFAVLLVMTKCRSVSGSFDDWMRWWPWNSISWRWRARPDRRALSHNVAYPISLGVGLQISFSRCVSLLRMVGSPDALGSNCSNPWRQSTRAWRQGASTW